MARDIVLGIAIHADAETVSNAIATREGLSKFWVPGVEGDPGTVGGETTYRFSGAPVDLKMRTDRVDAGKQIAWTCLGDFPGWKDTTVIWSMSAEAEHGGTNVTFRHDGFPDEQSDFELGSVAHTWAQILDHLKELAETGSTTPPLT
jgi:uncharacterized protein YndB with AHSA1/START domain